jgi:osmotically-inducible protein OsmY
VLQELAADPLVHEEHLGVDVGEGVVTLWGTVGTWEQRRAAAAAAHRVEGVLDVANDIAVEVWEASGRSEPAIARAVRRALASSSLVPAAHILSTVSGGVVTLEGDVGSWAQHADAERSVRVVEVVHSVINLLRVGGRSVAGPPPKRAEPDRPPDDERETRQAWLGCEDDEL